MAYNAPSLVASPTKTQTNSAPASRRETTTWETVEETANRLRISTRLLRELMKTGTVPFHRAGRRVVLDAVEVDEAIRRTMRKAA
jgi:excisionase family DNA binding protein